MDLFLCRCLWWTYPNRHSPASGLHEVMRVWTQTQSRCSQCKCWFWHSGLIVFALHLILGSPSLFSGYFVLESSLQISFTLGMVIPTSNPVFSKVRRDFLTLQLMYKPDLSSSKTSSPLLLIIFSVIHPKMSKGPKGIRVLPNVDVNITIFSWDFGDCLTQFQLASANT